MKEIRTNNHVKGIMYIIAAAIGFSFMTFFVKLSGDLPTMQKVFFRNAVALVIAALTMIKNKDRFYVAKGNRFDILMRCVFGTSGVIANFYAIGRLDLSDANMLNKLSPFFAIILSIPILKEKPTKTDVWATIIAFIGAVFIIRPSGTNLQLIPALSGLYSGFGAGTAYVFVRKLGKKGEKTAIIVLCFSLFSCLVSLPALIFDYHHMEPKQLIFLILAGLSAAVGQFGITSAYKCAPAKDISVFDYTQVLFAALWGILFLGEIPVTLSIIGYIIIIGVAVFRWHKARKESNLQ